MISNSTRNSRTPESGKRSSGRLSIMAATLTFIASALLWMAERLTDAAEWVINLKPGESNGRQDD